MLQIALSVGGKELVGLNVSVEGKADMDGNGVIDGCSVAVGPKVGENDVVGSIVGVVVVDALGTCGIWKVCTSSSASVVDTIDDRATANHTQLLH